MSGQNCRNRAAARLEKALEEFDRIVLIEGNGSSREFLRLFEDPQNFQNIQNRILILSVLEDKRKGNVVWQQAAEQEIEDMLKLYFLYEFSNRVIALSSRCCFGSLLDFVETGVLTEREALMALLR